MKKKKVRRKALKKARRKRPTPSDSILYLHVSPSTKIWLKSICKKQQGHVSQSNMIQRILTAAKKNPRIVSAANREAT